VSHLGLQAEFPGTMVHPGPSASSIIADASSEAERRRVGLAQILLRDNAS